MATPILLSPQNASFLQSSVRAYRAPRIKPPSERSPNPKPWGNWEGIGDFCLQKCQRGRQLSPLSEATRLDRSSLCSLRKCIKKKGRCPFRRLASPISPISQIVKDSVGFSESFVFLFYCKTCDARFVVILKRLSANTRVFQIWRKLESRSSLRILLLASWRLLRGFLLCTFSGGCPLSSPTPSPSRPPMSPLR